MLAFIIIVLLIDCCGALDEDSFEEFHLQHVLLSAHQHLPLSSSMMLSSSTIIHPFSSFKALELFQLFFDLKLIELQTAYLFCSRHHPYLSTMMDYFFILKFFLVGLSSNLTALSTFKSYFSAQLKYF